MFFICPRERVSDGVLCAVKNFYFCKLLVIVDDFIAYLTSRVYYYYCTTEYLILFMYPGTERNLYEKVEAESNKISKLIHNFFFFLNICRCWMATIPWISNRCCNLCSSRSSFSTWSKKEQKTSTIQYC